MGNYVYRENIHKDARFRRRIVAAVGIFIAIGVAFAAVVGLDYLYTPQVISQTDGTVLGRQEASETQTRFEEDSFSFSAPDGWIQVEPEKNVSSNHYMYRGDGAHISARSIEVYVGKLPANVHFNRLMLVQDDGARGIKPIKESEDCYLYANENGRAGDYIHSPTDVKWENITFTCHPSHNLNYVGIGTIDGGQGFAVGDEGLQQSFYIVYTDHTIQPDNTIFKDILKSFKFKEL